MVIMVMTVITVIMAIMVIRVIMVIMVIMVIRVIMVIMVLMVFMVVIVIMMFRVIMVIMFRSILTCQSQVSLEFYRKFIHFGWQRPPLEIEFLRESLIKIRGGSVWPLCE